MTPRVDWSQVMHEPMKPQTHLTEAWWRVPCGCGWVGTWWPSDAKAWRSFFKHQQLAKSWPATSR